VRPEVWIAVSLLTNLAVISVECLNRTSPSLLFALSRTWPLIVLAQFGLWYSYRHAPSLLMAWVVFTAGNSVLRLLATGNVLGETFQTRWAILGAGLIACGAFCMKRATTA